MKPLKIGMRLLITAASTFSFLMGWIFFAHSNKPAPLQASQQPAQPLVPLAQSPALPTPLPFRSQRQQAPSQIQPFQFQQAQPSFRPRFRTGGS